MSRRPVAPVPKQRSGTARTVILVAVFAVLVGVIVGRGLSNRSSGSSTGGTPSGTVAGGTTATTVKGSTSGGKGGTTVATAAPTIATTTTVNLRSFTGIVLNGNGISGTAGARSTELGAIGLKMAPAADAITKNFAASALYAVNQESVAAAQALAARIGVAYSGLYPAANPPAAVEKLGGATIVLLLGKDIANQALADKGAAAAAPAATTTAVAATTTTVKK